ncbi:MAG: methyltransferase domain-containing protein [Chloroflexi bacterium]|nr:methyltransferase domain-containing protein [Chloroflexota bacterium]
MVKRQGATETSWQPVSDWYGRIVGKEGHYYHEHVILPHSLRLLGLKGGDSLLDMACGQGVLARRIPEDVYYAGVDIAPGLIKQARRLDRNKGHIYIVADVNQPLPVPKKDFSHAALVLSLQNINTPEAVVQNAAQHLRRSGKLLVVLNHPCFRIPRQSSWEIDETKRIQYRRVDRYMTPLTVPIQAHPGRGANSETTMTYHFPLSYYSQVLFENGFAIVKVEEWVSDKRSVGAAAKMENRARREFPLFLAVLARKE